MKQPLPKRASAKVASLYSFAAAFVVAVVVVVVAVSSHRCVGERDGGSCPVTAVGVGAQESAVVGVGAQESAVVGRSLLTEENGELLASS